MNSPASYSRRLSTLEAANCWRSYRNLLSLENDSDIRTATDAKSSLDHMRHEKLARVLSLSIYCTNPVADLHCKY